MRESIFLSFQKSIKPEITSEFRMKKDRKQKVMPKDLANVPLKKKHKYLRCA